MANPRIIQISGEITQDTYDHVAECIVELEGEKLAPIHIWLNSVGGSIEQARAIYDLLSTSNCDIIGTVIGVCYSAAPAILQACKVRLATPNAVFMLHEGSVSAGDVHASEIKSTVEAYLREKDAMHAIILSRVIDKKKANRYNKAAIYFSAEEAKSLGLIDNVITRR